MSFFILNLPHDLRFRAIDEHNWIFELSFRRDDFYFLSKFFEQQSYNRKLFQTAQIKFKIQKEFNTREKISFAFSRDY